MTDEVRDLLEHAAPTAVAELDLPRARAEGRRRRTRRGAALTSTLVAAVAGVVLVAGGVVQPFGSRTSAWAAPLVAAAEDAPRVLVTHPGWEITRADVFGTDGSGEITFTDGNAALQVRWRPAAHHADLVEDRTRSTEERGRLTVLDTDSTVLRYGTAEDYTMLLRDGQFTIEARGRLPLDTYRDVVTSLERVGVDAWLSAMPPSVVQVSDRAATVRQMLSDIPTPDGFDAAALEDGPLRDRYQLGAEVAGSAACAWIDQWVQARQGGDDQRAATAVDAMVGSHDWAVLRQMSDSGAYPQVVWELADAMATDGTLEHGDDMTVQNSYQQSLGCDRFPFS